MNQAITCSLVPMSGAITSVRGPDEGNHLLHVAATEVLELLGLERARIDRDAALAAAEGKIGERAFPAHPDGERGDFADVDIGGEARAALGGTERQMMLDPVADEDLRPIVLHADRTGDDDRALRIEQPVAFVLGDAQMVGDDRELIAGHFEHGAGKEAAAHIRSPARSRCGRPDDSRPPVAEELKFALRNGQDARLMAALAAARLDFAPSLTILPANIWPAIPRGAFLARPTRRLVKDASPMAKAASLKIKLLSTADTGYFYVTKKNARTKTEKLTFKKYDPVARKHVEFKETKIK